MNKNHWKTTSLSLAVAIHVSTDSKLLFVERISEKQSSFVFNSSSQIEQSIERFWRKELLVDALSYFEALRYFKARLYQGVKVHYE